MIEDVISEVNTGWRGLIGMRLTRRELQFAGTCAGYIVRGEVPTVSRLWDDGFGNGRNINGRYTKIRTAMLEAAGFVKDSKSRWTRPVQT